MTSSSSLQNIFILRRSGVTNFDGIIKIVTVFVKKVFQNLKKSKELEIMYQNVYLYICIF